MDPPGDDGFEGELERAERNLGMPADRIVELMEGVNDDDDEEFEMYQEPEDSWQEEESEEEGASEEEDDGEMIVVVSSDEDDPRPAAPPPVARDPEAAWWSRYYALSRRFENEMHDVQAGIDILRNGGGGVPQDVLNYRERLRAHHTDLIRAHVDASPVPLTANFIAAIDVWLGPRPRVAQPFEYRGPGEPCPICIDRIEPGDSAARCFHPDRPHTFHAACVDEYRRTIRPGGGSVPCPLCRQNMQRRA